jgi:hypothetical protein
MRTGEFACPTTSAPLAAKPEDAGVNFSPSRRQAFYPILAHSSVRFPQHRRDAAIDVAAILAGQRDNGTISASSS